MVLFSLSAGLKALYSDARKRAAVAAGIGAYLYTALAPVVLPIGPRAKARRPSSAPKRRARTRRRRPEHDRNSGAEPSGHSHGNDVVVVDFSGPGPEAA
jgi:hypothetical protein